MHLKTLMQKIDRFCWKHPNFGVPRLMLYIVIGNLLVWLLSMMDTTGSFLYLLEFDPAMFCRGQIWRIVTFVLVPEQQNVLWLAVSLYFYYFIGSSLENEWGQGRFTIYYLCGVMLTVLYSLLIYAVTGGYRLVASATYINLSMFFAFATLWPDQMVLLFFFIPIKMKWLALVDAGFFLLRFVTTLLGGYFAAAFLPIVAIGNYMLFCGDWLLDFVFRNRRSVPKAKTVRFRSAVRKMEKSGQTGHYSRRCEVCGRTDTEYPVLEFRYCSRCAGYHCYCRDHIENHVHFTE